MKRLMLLPVVLLCSTAAMCAPDQHGFPRASDVQRMVEAKPVPSDAIAAGGAAGAKASADYSTDVESWGDRISSAAAIVCRNLVKQGMAGVTCPAP